MAESGFQINQEVFSCTICSELLEDPVTIPCGHSYCMSCVNTHWDGEVSKPGYSCPQCRQSFTQRPVLVKNTMLAVLVEGLKKTRLPVAPDHHCYAEPEDVACDMCSGRKKKAVKCCLQCLVSYCKEHIQPHYDVAALKRHKLVDPTENLPNNICPRHNEVMKMFCRTDQQCICYLCSVDEHKGHDTISAATERTERQRKLEAFKQKILQRIQDKEKDISALNQEENDIFQSVNAAGDLYNKSCEDLSCLVKEIITELKQQMRTQHEMDVHRFKDLQDKLQQEIIELERKDTELVKLWQTEDHYKFLQHFLSLKKLIENSDSSGVTRASFPSINLVTTFKSILENKLKDLENQTESSNVSVMPDTHLVMFYGSETEKQDPTLTHEFAPQPPVLERRHEFLRYTCDITFDPNTVSGFLVLSDENQKVRHTSKRQSHRKHPDRFNRLPQVLGEEALTGRCYWEVKMNFDEFLSVGVAYKDIPRKGPLDDCGFGHYENSWALDCYPDVFHMFWHNNIEKTFAAEPLISRVGIYLDHDAGTLAFYRIDDRMTLIHKIHTKFTQPLYATFYVQDEGDSAEICTMTDCQCIA